MRGFIRYNMKKLSLLFLSLVVAGAIFQSCSKSKTYAQQLKEERHAILNFIDDNQISVIDFAQFQAQDSLTDNTRNQYVLLDNGVYMQIQEKGQGRKLPDNGTNVEILCRYVEQNIATGDTISRNPDPRFESFSPELMICSKKNGVITGRFSEGYMTSYGSIVPNGWLSPLDFINLSRATSGIAVVRLIVPSKQGQSEAYDNVYPCYYEVSYQLANPIFD